MKKVTIRVSYQGETFNGDEISDAFNWMETQMGAVSLQECNHLTAGIQLSPSTSIEFLMVTDGSGLTSPAPPAE